MPDFSQIINGLSQFALQQGFELPTAPTGLQHGFQGDFSKDLGGIIFALGSLFNQGDRLDYLANNNSLEQRLRAGTVNTSMFPQGGYVRPITGFDPVQLEVDEVFITEQGDILNSKSEKKHKDLDDDTITDVLPEAYILSNRTSITKKEAENVVLETRIPTYSEHPEIKTQKFEEKTLADFMDSNEMTLASLAEQVRKKIPLVSEEQDLFNIRANQENRQKRQVYLTPLVLKNESEVEVPKFGRGGWKKAKKYPRGGDPSDAPWWAKLIPGYRRRTELYDRADVQEQRLGEVTDELTGNLNTSAALQSLFTLAQDPQVVAPDLTVPRNLLTQQYDRVPEHIRRSTFSQINRQINPFIGQALESTSNFGRASNLLANLYGQGINATTGAALNFANQDIGLRNSYLQNLGNFETQNSINQANAFNQTTTNQNQQLAGLGNITAGLYSGRNAVAANQFNAQQSIDAGYNQSIDQARSNTVNGLFQLLNLGVTAATGIPGIGGGGGQQAQQTPNSVPGVGLSTNYVGFNPSGGLMINNSPQPMFRNPFNPFGG